MINAGYEMIKKTKIKQEWTLDTKLKVLKFTEVLS